MAKRLNRLLAAIAAAATLATGVAGSAWADTADGKVSFDVKAADGTTLDGLDVGLYKVGNWNMDALERDESGGLTGIHAISTDMDDQAGFQVAEDGTQTTVTPHGRAAGAAESAGVTFGDSADPLDTVWTLGPSDSRVRTFAKAYAKELADAKATPDATAKGAGDIRLDPGVYIAMLGADADTAVLAGTATVDGSILEERAGMGSATLEGDAVKADGEQNPGKSDTTVESELYVAEDKSTDASDDTTRIWRIGDLGDTANTVVKGLEEQSTTEKAAVKQLSSLFNEKPAATIKGTGGVKVSAGWYLTDTNGQRHVTAVGAKPNGSSLTSGQIIVEGSVKRSKLDMTLAQLKARLDNGIATYSSGDDTITYGNPINRPGVNSTNYQFIWHSVNDGDREAFCVQPNLWPYTGKSTPVLVTDSKYMDVWRAYFFYGVGGPGDWFAKNGISANDGRNIMHIQMSYLWYMQTGDSSQLINGDSVDKFARGREWVNYAESHPVGANGAVGNDGRRYLINVWQLNPPDSSKQTMYSSTVRRSYDLDLGTQVVTSNDTDSRDDDRTWISDTVAVTSRNGDWPNNERLNMTVTLNYDPTPDGINPDGTVQANNASDRKSVTKSKEWSLSNGLPNGHTEYFHPDWFHPADLFGQGKGWQLGRYWFDVKVTRGGGNIHMNKDMYEHSGYADGNEGFNRTLVTGRTAAKIKVGGSWADLSDASTLKNLDGSNAPIRDYVNLSGTYPRYKADSNNGGKRQTFTVKQTLHHRDASGKTTDSAVKTFKYAYNEKMPLFADQNSPEFTPSDLGMKDGWDSGDYWFDNVIEGHLTEGSATDPKADGYRKNTETPGETSVVKTWHSHGQTEENEHWTIAPTAVPTISTKAVASGATVGATQPVHDSITVTNHDPNRAIAIAKVTTILHMRTGNRKASKTVGPVTIPAGGSKTFDSANFTPADLGRKCWSNGRYWFDANISATDVTYPSGAKALTADLVHDGRNDTNQVFSMTMDSLNGFSTQAQSTFSTAGGTSATHDRLLLTTDPDSLANDLSVKVTLNWNASATGTTATKTTTKTDVFTAGSAYKDLKAFTPSDLGMANGWLAGRYWYVVTIPAQDGVDDTIVLDGLKKDTAKESWTAVMPYTLDLAKLAYIGQPGQGRWSNEPVKGATFTLTETTDGTGTTAKPGTSPKTVTTDANGSAHLLDGTIGATEIRWYKLVETAAPASYAKPGKDAYWMVTVKGGADKATITATGSNAEAKALLKGLDGSTITVGNRLEGSIMPPMTGGTYDVMRALGLAGVITLAILAGGVAWLRRRNRTVGRHAR